MHFETEKWIGGIAVRPGALWHEPVDAMRFTLVTRCESVNPDVFTGAVMFDHVELLRTDGHGTKDAASRAAREVLLDRVIALFGT